METPLDRAHAAMQAAPEDERARLRYFERVADGELFVLLAAEPGEQGLDFETFPVGGGRYVLAFDREERLAAFAGRPAPYAALSGRALANMLAGQGLGLGLNLGALSETLLAAEALGWLAATLGHEGPEETEARPEEFRAPVGLPEPLIEALSVKLALAAGLARAAWLCGVSYEGGRRGHLLAFVDAEPGAEAALARAVSEALVFSGIEAGALDVAFLDAADPAAARLATVGLGFEIPKPAAPEPPAAPGSDPARPPRLR
ncbi:MAG: SseB family protein [Paracoccaceae bacterium]|nr:SseB family protein [Paracoccaceae bacterium]